MANELSIYECADIIQQIEAIAEQNDGEIPEDQLALLVQAQTTEMSKLNSLCGFMRFVQGRIDHCKTEEQRIAGIRKTAESRLESIKAFLVPFVSQYRKDKGHPLAVGTFTLSTRKSESVEIDELAFFTDENRAKWCNRKESYVPDKKRIKTELDNPLATIAGAKIVESESLQVK